MTNNTHKIINKKTGATLEGEITHNIHGPNFAFRIAGTTGANDFFQCDWDIEEVKPPVPTEPGFYVDTSGPPTLARVYRLVVDGTWYGHLNAPRAVEIARLKRADLPANLVRLVPEITKVTDEMVIAFEDNSTNIGPIRESRRAGILAAIKGAQK